MFRTAIGNISATLKDAITRVSHCGERVILCRRGKDIAALVPMKDLAILKDAVQAEQQESNANRQNDKESFQPIRTAQDLLDSELVGLWKTAYPSPEV